MSCEDTICMYNIEQTVQMWPCLQEIPKKKRLPSCSTKREDLGLWCSDDENGADATKIILENSQRKDRKFREDFTFYKKD